jgi:hypothetical protein
MNLSLEFLERCSAETAFQVSELEKVTRIGEMAANIARDPMLGEVLALKGGTALNLCFGPPTRLSVDDARQDTAAPEAHFAVCGHALDTRLAVAAGRVCLGADRGDSRGRRSRRTQELSL